MRWSNLTLEAEQTVRLPGYRDEAVVRHFEAPDSIATRFYEVRAKSILNRVPEASQMPFRWTVNPYRGCTHACSYCVWGQTPVLLADGTHKPIEAIEVGDEIYGTRRGPFFRSYACTTVIDKWISIKPAYRVVLEDDTELILSGDHRLLTDRGWKHVIDHGPGRPHLTSANHLVGTGAFVSQPAHDREYRRGYLCGVIRGDGTLGRSRYERPGRSSGDVYRFRLAVCDREAIARSRGFLETFGVPPSEFAYATASGAHRAATAIPTQRRAAYQQITELIAWPEAPCPQWCRGFLAGIFDAEGSRSAFAVRIANRDPQILGQIEACAKRFRFDVCRDRTSNPSGLQYIRFRGGLSEHLRFFHLTDPAISRKRDIEGRIVKTFKRLRVLGVEPLGCELPLYDITTGTGDFIANGVVSHNCFARPTHKYLEFDAGRDFEREIIVKVNAPERLRAELAKPSWKGEHVALGTNTDPYQWVEGRYKLMRGIWEAMIDARNPSSVLTKSPLLLRDLDLMAELNAVTEFSAALSIPTLEERAWRASEPHTPHPRARMEAVAELNRAGIRTGVLVAPLMPGINDDPAQVADILELSEQAGAAFVTPITLHLRGEVRQLFMTWLQANRPDLVGRYRDLYRSGAYAPERQRRRHAELVAGAGKTPLGGRVRPIESRPDRPSQVPGSEQASLFEDP